MAIIRPEVTGCSPGTALAAIGHNGGPPLEPANWIELQRIVDLKEAARLAGCSVDTLKRHHRDKIISISERRCGMRVGHALMLNASTVKDTTA